MTDITATTEAQVIDAVEGARDWKSPLNIIGNRTKRSFGRPTAAWGTVLDVSGLKGIVDYKPEELIITAKPGTPAAEITAALAEKNQRLGFDPSDLGPLFGATANTGTIGGAIACDLNGPAAMRYGRVRDHLLGIRAVNGYAEAFKAGGKVVKNVTGFDIPKLFCGAFGTLGVLTEVTLRVFPKPEHAVTFAVSVPDRQSGLAMLRRVWQSPLESTGLACLPTHDIECTAYIRLEGAAVPLQEKRAALSRLLDTSDLPAMDDGDAPFARLGASFASTAYDVWRIVTPPSHTAAILDRLKPALWAADWAGGLLWIGVEKSDPEIHDILASYGSHAVLIRASDETRNTIAPFPPLSPERLALTKSVKDAFDPLSLFNPGRMYNDI